ncbi:unnamed protein product [Protopolystoma xenopodis]|uniref:Uncharacterized protein n=1 Tax=Protopolystoma xenopodis TaxID=117903 RepID=A0A448XPC6_9PLAT|nr:unnamed protein product [Protopolystoma xenopodis]
MQRLSVLDSTTRKEDASRILSKKDDVNLLSIHTTSFEKKLICTIAEQTILRKTTFLPENIAQKEMDISGPTGGGCDRHAIRPRRVGEPSEPDRVGGTGGQSGQFVGQGVEIGYQSRSALHARG